jgi:hypothetical protein
MSLRCQSADASTRVSVLPRQAEARWCAKVFPAHVRPLLTALARSLAERLRDSFQARLAEALQEAQVRGPRGSH